MARKATINVQDTDISVLVGNEQDYFSLTDIAKRVNEENPSGIVINWLRLKEGLLKISNQPYTTAIFAPSTLHTCCQTSFTHRQFRCPAALT